jgi:hypothetical protein
LNKEERQQVEVIGRRIREEGTYALRVFRAIHAAQKPEEKFTGEYMGSDGGWGFTPPETRMWNDLYDRIEARGHALPSELDQLRKGMYKHREQYWKLYRRATDKRREELRGAAKPQKSAYRSVATTPSESPERGADDSLAFLRDVPVEKRAEIIERMAKRMGV